MKRREITQLVLAAFFMAIGIVLPMFTGQIKEIGDTLLPMHIPVMLCGLLCGMKYGLAVGFLLPFVRSFLFTMPPLYPNAVWMAFELAAYGGILGFLYGRLKKKSIVKLYVCMLISMVLGRIVWGVVKSLLLIGSPNRFTFMAFLAGGVLDAIPGIILQLVFIPAVMALIHRIETEK